MSELFLTIPVGFLQTNCYLVPLDGAKCIVIDPGDEGERIAAEIEGRQLEPCLFLLTHGHSDHTQGLPALHAKWPDVPIAMHKSDLFMLEKSRKSLPLPTEFVEEGHKGSILPKNWTVLHTPGHTPGSCCYWLKDKGILFSGDTLFNMGIGRTDLPGGNQNSMERSLKRLLALDPSIKVYPGHGPETTIGAESKII
ncbi:MAG: MBL fold metallo-hydrolase [Spirochaetaceae bacterium]|jgi:glyoxylase-like metal-dependent hydrolase (beta-lactamase superfamily II)|nr:MBL fold metallo-hydrolase [Spirochaetaceae bacterium]